jgi:hypothetical protein
MKKISLYVLLVLGLLFLFKYSFSIKTYLKCESYNQESEKVSYFAFDKHHIWSDYDQINSKFKKKSNSSYGEKHVISTTFFGGTIKINREIGTVKIEQGLTLLGVPKPDLVLNCKKINKRKLPKEKIDKKF